VDMNYGVGSQGGSGAYVVSSASPVTNCSEYALETYFGYKTSLEGVTRYGYTTSQWVNLLKSELDAGRPILYAGYGGGGGHCFVTDGYDDSNNFFHFNWGWSAAYDGFFAIDALNPGGVGTGGGSGGYNSSHQAVIGIEPIGGGGGGGTPTADLQLYDYVTPTFSTIYYGGAFGVTTNIYNNGTNTFNGDYCAAVFDNNMTFVDYVEILSGNSLASGYVYTGGLTFSTSGLLSMLPGNYFVGVFFRPTGGNWVQVANAGGYTNMTPMTVINPNDIEMYSAMTLSPSSALVQGQPASVTLNLVNDGTATYTGLYDVSLYDLDGTWIETVGTIEELSGLPSGYVYLSPYLTFSSTAIAAPPGSYLLAVTHLPSGGSNYEIVGSSYYQNPVMVTVQGPTLQGDIYEANNTQAQAYNLPITFSGNAASKNTQGSNCHTGTDYDFYKIVLPPGSSYNVTPRLQDSYDNNNGLTYTLDAMFTYSTDGSTWSAVYDDVIPSPIVLSNGGTVYYHVSPYFSGQTGTYRLDMDITRSTTVGISEPGARALVVFPNPASGVLNVDLTGFAGGLNQFEIVNALGQTVYRNQGVLDGDVMHLPLDGFANGVYKIQVLTADGLVSEKFVVQK